MNDEKIMENLLLTTKGACDLYLHGTIESSTQNVHAAFDDVLGGNARHAGLKIGDQLVQLEDRPIRSTQDVRNILDHCGNNGYCEEHKTCSCRCYGKCSQERSYSYRS